MTESIKALRMEKRRKKLELRADEVEKLNADVRERLIFIINNFTVNTGRYEQLEDRYGIAARKWKNVCNRVQLPGINMLSSIAKDFPNFAMWLMLGNAETIKQIDPSEGVVDNQVSITHMMDVIAFLAKNKSTTY